MELPIKARPASTSYTLETKNLSYKLYTKFDELNRVCFNRIPDADPNFILKEVNCEARPGEVTAIAGPSGAGKTTLLEILAGKISGSQVVDKVMVNNRPMDVKRFRKLSGFVTQDDALFPLLTVQETLTYSALLRLPGGKKLEAMNRVDLLIKELGLDHVKGSRVHGISGGERRRVSIGVDLVHDPVVLLIDEPTSGLDSASALHIIALLKSMAVKQGKTIILTIHQPGFRILETFDRILLLSNGNVIHNGSLRFLHERLQFSGHRIPRHVNVLEFAINVIETLDKEFDCIEHHPGLKTRTIPCSNVHQQILPSYPNSILKEVVILGKRFCCNVFRSKQLFATRIIQALVAGFILGTIFLNVGRNIKAGTLQSQLGFFAFTLTFLLSSTTEVLPIFLQERRIVMQETTRGAYRVTSYVLSNFIIFLPFLLLVGLLFSVPVYWLVGLRGEIDGFGYFTLVIWMVLLMSNSFVACFSALVPNFIMGSSVISGLFGSFFLFSGYFIAKNRIPSYWMFMHYLSLFKYPYECLLINEFGGQNGKRRCLQFDGGVCSMNGSEFLRQQHLQESQKWTNLGVMFGFIIGYRLLCFVILWFRHYRNR